MSNETLKEQVRRRINVIGRRLEKGCGSDNKKLTQAQWYRIEGELLSLRDVQRHLNGINHPSSGCSLCNRELS